jgi:hypothetical protein
MSQEDSWDIPRPYSEAIGSQMIVTRAFMVFLYDLRRLPLLPT